MIFPEKDINDQKFNSELSPWVGTFRFCHELKNVPIDHFILPISANIILGQDKYYHNYYGSWWKAKDSASAELRSFPYIRAINDDIVLYRRMEYYKKTGEILSNDDYRLIQIGDWIVNKATKTFYKVNDIIDQTGILKITNDVKITFAIIPEPYRLATSEEIKAHLSKSTSTNLCNETPIIQITKPKNMNTITPVKIPNPANFAIDCQGIDQNLLDILYDFLKKKGIIGNNPLGPGLRLPYNMWVIREKFSWFKENHLYYDSSKKGHETHDLPVYSALTQFPEIIRILSQSFDKIEIKIPEIHGYKASYKAGDTTVTFGCANIDIEMLKRVDKLLNTITKEGNRVPAAIQLYSSSSPEKILTREQVREILSYIAKVDKN